MCSLSATAMGTRISFGSIRWSIIIRRNRTNGMQSNKLDPASFFMPIGNTKPYFKAAFEGFAGCGKTYTSALIAVGLHQRIGSTKPIVIFDTEESAKFLKPLFASHNIEVFVKSSKSLL